MIRTIFLFLSLSCCCLSSCTETSTKESTTTKAVKNSGVIPALDAIDKAEKFIAEQGYTEAAVDLKKTKIIFGEGEFASDTSAIVALRKNTLLPKASGARNYGKNKSWAVGFRQIPYENNIVQAVVMDSLGNNLKLAPNTMREDWVKNMVISE